jgi:KDO2-lipid IV(A) lauroyltransferase
MNYYIILYFQAAILFDCFNNNALSRQSSKIKIIYANIPIWYMIDDLMKKLSKKIKRALARWAYYFFYWFFSLLPINFIFMISGFLLSMAFPFLIDMRNLAKESLTIAFAKEKTADEINKILKSCFFNLGRGYIEMFCYVQRPALILKKLHLTPGSRENLDNALKEKKGVIGVSAHFGNFSLMLLHLSKLGYPIHTIIRPSRDAIIEKSFQKHRARMNFKTILSLPRYSCVRQSLIVLKKKEIVAVLMDQNTDEKTGVFVDFFGQKAGTPTGAVVFAMRTGSPILPMFTIRDGKDSHKIIIEPHFYIEIKPTEEETLQYNVQKITNIIEKYIRQYPQEWGWMNRRWKSKPKASIPAQAAG